MSTRAATLRAVTVWSSIGIAIAGGLVVVALRAVNEGIEPEGRNWWIAAEIAIGIGFLPSGVFLLSSPRCRLLGAAFVTVGVTQLSAALASQVEAYAAFVDGSRVSVPGGSEVIETIGLLVLAAGVPWLLPWKARRGPEDPLRLWLALGVGASLVGTLCAVTPLGRLVGADVLGPLMLLAAVPLLVFGAIVGVARDESPRFASGSHRFLVWSVLAAGIVVVYTVVVAGFGALLGGNRPAWLLVGCTAGIAAALEPARRHVREIVDRVIYGERDDPLALVRELMQQVTTSVDVGALLPALAATLGHAMRLDHVAIDAPASRALLSDPPAGDETSPGCRRLASFGAPTANLETFALATGDDPIGFLTIGCRAGSGLRARDRRALEDIVPHVAIAVSLVELTAHLRRSNLAIVTTREEERRRLRRDLHDGLGPCLTGIGLGLRSVVGRLRREAIDPETTELLDRLTRELDTASAEVKRIVRDLRPTALDDHGLTGALREFALRLGDAVRFDLDLPAQDATLPAAVEIATYRITTEALTNVVRHAGASSCRVRLVIGEHVDIDVTDDGVGLADPRPSGMGLHAMHERVTALGGTLDVTCVAPHGTRVHARLPVEIALP